MGLLCNSLHNWNWTLISKFFKVTQGWFKFYILQTFIQLSLLLLMGRQSFTGWCMDFEPDRVKVFKITNNKNKLTEKDADLNGINYWDFFNTIIIPGNIFRDLRNLPFCIHSKSSVIILFGFCDYWCVINTNTDHKLFS